MATSNNTVVCDDCGLLFPLRESTGLCMKCVKLEGLSVQSEDYAEKLKWPQCQICGVTRRNMPRSATGEPQLCGSVKCAAFSPRATEDAAGPSQPGDGVVQPLQTSSKTHNIPETFQVRAAALMDRMKLSAQHHKAVSGTILTTPALLHHEHGGGSPGDAKFYICWQVRNGKTPGRLDAALGSHSKMWSGSVYMTDVVAEITSTINLHWGARWAPLLPEHVVLRWFGNRHFEPNTSTLQLSEFYKYYNTPKSSPLYFGDIPTAFKHVKKHKIPVLCFDAFIQYDLWKKWCSPDENNEDDSDIELPIRANRGQKRSKSSTSSSTQVRPSKKQHPFGFGAPSSHFSLSNRSISSRVQHRSTVILLQIICTADRDTGICSLIDSSIEIRGKLADNPFSCGTMKAAYDLLSEDGSQLVAKRFIKMDGNGDEDATVESSNVSVTDNRSEVEAELIRLTQGQWFLDAFFKHCQNLGNVTVDRNIAFAEAYLGQEIGTFSKASDQQRLDGSNSIGITWLVETKRPTTVMKYSGTLNHRARQQDIRAHTIQAFAHFAFGHSKKTLVFADIQGSPAQIKGRDGFVLFDVMTHTTDGTSGLGDFGNAGIRTFVEQHKCNTICFGLGLDRVMPLTQVTQVDDLLTEGDNDGDDGQTLGEEEQRLDQLDDSDDA